MAAQLPSNPLPLRKVRIDPNTGLPFIGKLFVFCGWNSKAPLKDDGFFAMEEFDTGRDACIDLPTGAPILFLGTRRGKDRHGRARFLPNVVFLTFLYEEKIICTGENQFRYYLKYFAEVVSCD